MKNIPIKRLISSLFLLSILLYVQDSIAQAEKIILDTDMGSDCDDVGAMAVLHHFADQGKVEILGVIYSSGKVPYGVGIIDAINVYYGRPEILIGASHDLSFGDPKDKMHSEKLAKDTIAYKNRLIHNLDAMEQTALNRQLLIQAPDNSITYITIGHTKGLYELIKSSPGSDSPLTGLELVSRKVKRWVALGALGASNEEGLGVKDWNFFRNNTATYTHYLIDHFPKPAYFVDAGANVFTGESLEALNPGNILRTAYRDWLWNVEHKKIRDQRPSWDLATVYFSVMGTGDFLQELGPGALIFDPEEGSRWVSNRVNPLHHFILQRKDVDKAFAVKLNAAISAKPENSIVK
ncbi:nucleoside hydrolase [uncultured Cyclobacterium sp.]|uniref:nucleoside hydrolase n=1 Tax=uncultured Cyclobacterium sp. TaxID=453820 RepID=UPI0030ECAE59